MQPSIALVYVLGILGTHSHHLKSGTVSSTVGAHSHHLQSGTVSSPVGTHSHHLQSGTVSSTFGATPNNKCECAPFHKCFDNETSSDTFGIVDDRVNIIGTHTVITVKPSSEPSVCPTVLEVHCCKLDPAQSSPHIPPQVSGAVPTTPQGARNGLCGVMNPEGFGVSVNGFTEGQSQYGEFPWTVALLTSNTGFGSDVGANNLFVGGGSLISRHVVLTAAHKPYDLNRNQTLSVRVGEWDFRGQHEVIQHQDIPVDKVIYHPNFSRDTMVYNIALLVLERPVELGETVSTICLPTNSDQKFDGDKCIVSGWGKNVFGSEGRYQRIMKKVRVNMVEHSRCQTALRNTRLGSDFNLHESFVCAGDQGEDACTGDGGSPLVCPDPMSAGQYVQVGISAWGIGCGDVGIPGAYSAIPLAVDWIRHELTRITDFCGQPQGPC